MRKPLLVMGMVVVCAVGCKEVPDLPPIELPPDGEPPSLPADEAPVVEAPRRTREEVFAEPLLPDEESISEYTPEELREYEQEGRFQRGEAADVDGDGYKERVGHWNGDVFTYEIDENRDGIPDDVYDGTTHTVDWDFDGKPNMVETRTLRPNGGRKLVRELDEDEDGFTERRETMERLSPDTKRIRMETRTGPDAPWEVEDEFVEPMYHIQQLNPETLKIIRGAQGKAAPKAKSGGRSAAVTADTLACVRELDKRFPTDISKPYYGRKGLIVPYGRPALGRCTAEQGKKVSKALSCVRKRAMSCLDSLNPGIAKRLRELMEGVTEDGAPLPQAVVSCSGECDLGGITRHQLVIGGREVEAIELTQGITNVSDTVACEMLLHEVMHAAGIPVGRTHDTQGQDRFYSCARVCPGCSDSSIGAGNFHEDCARCADTPKRKAICGAKLDVTDVVVTDTASSCVRSGPAPFTVACSARQVNALLCDDTPYPDVKPAYCCASCPPTYSVPAVGNWCPTLKDPTLDGNSCDKEDDLIFCQT
jgi:hypothetical protein